MKVTYRALFIAYTLLFAHPLLATPNIVVQSVQMPAWLQHSGLTQPLVPGMVLGDNDTVLTGLNARALLQSADGSAIKLGENASLVVSKLSQGDGNKTLFSAFLEVAKGAFRFTTSAASKLKSRDVTIKIADATIGIRGTDVWGKDGDDKRVLCLIEGHISVQGLDKTEFTMDQPLSFYEMPKSQTPKAVAAIAPDLLNKWALETEVNSEIASTVAGGKWKVTLSSFSDQPSVLVAYDAWRAAGYAVKILPVTVASQIEYRLRIEQLSTRADALILAKSITGKLGATNPTVSR